MEQLADCVADDEYAKSPGGNASSGIMLDPAAAMTV
jgi:hypothetical protein